jgi:hypothetical protein
MPPILVNGRSCEGPEPAYDQTSTVIEDVIPDGYQLHAPLLLSYVGTRV